MFVAFLALQGVKHQTSKSYMSALRHMQIEAGLGDPFAGGAVPETGIRTKRAKTFKFLPSS